MVDLWQYGKKNINFNKYFRVRDDILHYVQGAEMMNMAKIYGQSKITQYFLQFCMQF